jgi:3-isopropylmalate/(R)-2-methylmalate dehydratase small subunit|tara:strand:+ start:133 stop:777 length:645 start_codon:yes stop_codon:yes gene_type:complete
MYANGNLKNKGVVQMDAFNSHTGIVTPLDRANVDTDQIIPAEYLKRVERSGFGPFLFNDWRKLPNGKPNPDFVLNKAFYDTGTVLVTRKNFGSGSSREHAVWALMNHGFKAVISSSFAEIFHKNSFENGLVPVIVPDEQISIILERASKQPGYQIHVDLNNCELSDDHGLHIPFRIHEDDDTHAFRRNTLMNGLDSISLTLANENKITAYENRS